MQKSRFFDGYAEKNTADKKLKELKMLNPGISGAIKTGEKIKLPEMTPEKELRVQRNVLMGIEKYTPEGVELTHEQKELSHKLYLILHYIYLQHLAKLAICQIHFLLTYLLTI